MRCRWFGRRGRRRNFRAVELLGRVRSADRESLPCVAAYTSVSTGFSGSQVALRAGHDPSVAVMHYAGRIAEIDRALARAVASLLVATAEDTA